MSTAGTQPKTQSPKRSTLSATAVGTELFSPGESLVDFVVLSLKNDNETCRPGDVLCLTSKLVSLAEHRLVPKDDINKRDLILRECDTYLGEGACGVEITLKEGLLLPSAGIDESNSPTGGYILYPKNVEQSVRTLHHQLANVFGYSNFGLVFTDSRSLPLRRGVTGVALGYWGFRGLRSRVGELDLYGKPLAATQINLVDAMATAAVVVMGEAAEQAPLAIVRGLDLEYFDGNDSDHLKIERENDLFQPLWKVR